MTDQQQHSNENIRVVVRVRKANTTATAQSGTYTQSNNSTGEKKRHSIPSLPKLQVSPQPGIVTRPPNPPTPTPQTPSTPSIDPPHTPCITIPDNNSTLSYSDIRSVSISDPEERRMGVAKKEFAFDTVFPPRADQKAVYEHSVRPLISKCLDGYNGTIFAYGQTASGKTYTMQGPGRLASLTEMERGIMPRVAQQICDYVESSRKTVNEGGYIADCIVKVSYMEIYNEVLTDLLAPRVFPDNLRIRIDPNSATGKDLYVQGLSERYVTCFEDYMVILDMGSKNRTVGETDMNEASSRSHAILTITIDQYLTKPAQVTTADSGISLIPESEPSILSEQSESREGGLLTGGRTVKLENQIRKRSKIHLVDLAGSERAAATGAKGQRLKEGAAINTSLSCLGNVIGALTSGGGGGGGNGSKRHVPYRDSKLTYLLSDSIGGNSLTLMITCCSPLAKNFSESLSTLRFAERVKKVQNKAHVNIDFHALRILNLEAEIKMLQERLSLHATPKSSNQTIATQTDCVSQAISCQTEQTNKLLIMLRRIQASVRRQIIQHSRWKGCRPSRTKVDVEDTHIQFERPPLPPK